MVMTLHKNTQIHIISIVIKAEPHDYTLLYMGYLNLIQAYLHIVVDTRPAWILDPNCLGAILNSSQLILIAEESM